jgi:hypothetical protein
MLVLLACVTAEVDIKSPRPNGTTGDDDPGDSGEVVAELAAATGVSARLNDTVGSVIYVTWTQAESATAWVEYSFDAGRWLSSPPQALDAGSHEALVLGAPFGTEVTYRVVLSDGADEAASSDATISTDALPEGAPEVAAAKGDATLWDSATNYVLIGMSGEGESFDGDWWTFILDRQGRVVWALPTPYGFVSLYPRVSQDGRALLIDYNSYWGQFDGGALSQVARTGIEGAVETTWDTPGLHHSFTQLPDGTLVWGYLQRGEETLEELTAEGDRRTLWRCKSFLEGLGERPACGSNTVFYDETTDHFLFSFYSNDTVVEVDHATGETVRWFGNIAGSYAFDPPESQFWWQHGPNLTADGTLLISTHQTEHGEEATVVREFAIDAENQTLRQIWSFGTEDEDQVWGEHMGEAWRLDGGNTLHNYGSTPRLREVTPAGEVVWNVVWPRTYTLGRSTPIDDLYAFAP